MLFSIVIPVYNRAEKVNATLQSVLAQTHRPLQVVLVDNFSTDGTLRVLKDFQAQHSQADFEVVVTQEQMHSAPAARTKGFSLVRGEWTLFFDSDDTMAPTLVKEYNGVISRLEAAAAPPDIVAVKARWHGLHGESHILPFLTTDPFANHILHSILATQRYAVRTSFFAATDGWNSQILQWNDWELGVRLLLHEPKIAFIDKPLVDIYDSGAASITGTNFADRQGKWERVLDEAQHWVSQWTNPDKHRLLRLIDFRRVVLAAHYEREGYAEAATELYTPAYRRLAHGHLLARFAVPLLYRHIVRGHRGASRIARLILR